MGAQPDREILTSRLAAEQAVFLGNLTKEGDFSPVANWRTFMEWDALQRALENPNARESGKWAHPSIAEIARGLICRSGVSAVDVVRGTDHLQKIVLGIHGVPDPLVSQIDPSRYSLAAERINHMVGAAYSAVRIAPQAA